MSDFYEVDFLNVCAERSGDAITIAYRIGNTELLHVVDGGYQSTGEHLVAHIRNRYGSNARINHVVATHNDRDHAGGLRLVLEKFQVDRLWMNRPWIYADQIIHLFPRWRNVERFAEHLRSVYSNLAALEDLAIQNRIPVYEAFAGTQIGAFTVLSPHREFFLELICRSVRTPDSVISSAPSINSGPVNTLRRAVNYVRAKWGVEAFSEQGTTAENEMSIVQFAMLANDRILLTSDAGREALTHAADLYEAAGGVLPGLEIFQAPHHGSRRNVTTKLLDRWLGSRSVLPRLSPDHGKFAPVSATKSDDLPKNAVLRALWHRGYKICSNENFDNGFVTLFKNSDRCLELSPVPEVPYPSTIEAD